MADFKTLLAQIEGGAGELAAHWDDEIDYWLTDMQNGHPRAQDFEPTGHGGSDPTATGGIRPDLARQDRKAIEDDIKAAWSAIDNARQRSRRYRNGVRPPQGPIEEEFCFMHYKYEKPYLVYRKRLCRACYDHRRDLAVLGLELTDDEVRYHATWGKWPKGQRVDPRATPARSIASVDRLTFGTGALTGEQAATRLLGTST